MNTLTLIKREIKLSIRNFGLILSYSSFFLLSLLIFTFGVGPDIKQLNTVYIPIIWVIMLFAIILVSDNFLLSDFQDGSLKELQYLGYSEESIILSKTIVMYIVLITPHFFLIPIFSIFYNINFNDLLQLSLDIFIGMPSLILISLIASLLTIQIKRNKVLQFIIIMPFYVPIIIFTTSNYNGFFYSSFELNKILILIGFFLITLPITLLLGKLILNEINK